MVKCLARYLTPFLTGRPVAEAARGILKGHLPAAWFTSATTDATAYPAAWVMLRSQLTTWAPSYAESNRINGRPAAE